MSISLLSLIGGCGQAESAANEPKRVAREYVEAWCRGDGLHTLLEFGPEELPEPFAGLNVTSHDLPGGAPVATIEVETVKLMGRGRKPELSDYAFWINGGPSQAESTCFL